MSDSYRLSYEHSFELFTLHTAHTCMYVLPMDQR